MPTSHDEATLHLVAKTQVTKPTAVICGGDSGVKMADALSTFLGLQGNSSDVNRRDKLVQQEAKRALFTS